MRSTGADILVVDDEADIRELVSGLLEDEGHAVRVASNGLAAVEEVRRGGVDLVIMDVQMPVMDGLRAVSHIRNGEVPGTSRRLPVVAVARKLAVIMHAMWRDGTDYADRPEAVAAKPRGASA